MASTLSKQSADGICPGNTTTAKDPQTGVVSVTLYQTVIATLTPAKGKRKASVLLNTGGYNTPTTHRRMNQCLIAWGYQGVRVGKSDFIDSNTKTVTL